MTTKIMLSAECNR